KNHGQTALKIDRVGLDRQGLAFVEIFNTSSADADLTGLYLTGWLRTPRQTLAPPVLLGPGARLTLSEGASDPDLRLQATIDRQFPEVGLYDVAGAKPIDLMILAPLVPGQAYGRAPSGSETLGAFPVP
ncbi:MAG: hypothetical protein HY901_30795, partial [Deltaproteobacteria bacterium]|nr:hypothetical protein [Deltaproteobacteria bacterium]